jgi:hypothetical protein
MVSKSGNEDTLWPSLPYISFSSNAPPPRLRSKLLMMVFTPKDKHSAEEKKQFNQFIRLNAHKLRTLGNFAISYLLLHPEVL